TETVIACIDDFSKCLKKKTVLVIDNASVHTSKAIKAKIPQWQEKGLELFYLPTYSPELNLIEILWRFMKYEWIEFYAYKSWENLIEYVENVLRNFGEKYIINYG
ncbi:transposase, partial [Candidatus Magnetoovum chiemensis]